MKIKKSARERRRYFLLGGDKKEIEKIVFGIKDANPRWIKDFRGKRVILSVNRKEVYNVRDILLDRKIRIKRISGTIKGLGK